MVPVLLRTALCTLCASTLLWAAAFAQGDNAGSTDQTAPSDQTTVITAPPSPPPDQATEPAPAPPPVTSSGVPADETVVPEERTSAPASSGVTFSDVPLGHWAYDALDYLQQAGLVQGYPDGTFRGDRPFSRNEMAVVVARIFTKLQDWMVANGGASGTGPPLKNGADMDEVYARLNKLSDEFRDELDKLGTRMTAVEDEQTKMKDEMNTIRGLIKDSGLSGTARWRTGAYLSAGGGTAAKGKAGFEQEIRLNYKFKVDEHADFHLSMTSYENEGPTSDAFKPGLNNETPGGNPSPLPAVLRRNSSSFLLDEAFVEYCWNGAPKLFGRCPTVTIGRHYFSEGEFGLAGDNGYRSLFGLRADFSLGRKLDAHAALYRPDSVEKLAPFSTSDNLFQSSALTGTGDDYLEAGLAYHNGEATVPGHDYKFVLRGDVSPNGFEHEKFMGVSGNAQLPWFGRDWLNGIRGEWVMVQQNAAGQKPANLGISNNSFVFELDLFNNKDTRVTGAYAQIAQIEALPVFANVDNDPFSEWDFTMNAVGDAFNFSREGRNWFPSDFKGFGLQAEHRFGGSLRALLTYYTGTRVDGAATARPGLLRLGLRFPASANSQVGLDYISSGLHKDLADPVTLIRGEYRINF